MTRVLSGAVLLLLAIAVVWFAPAIAFLIVAELLLVLAFVEYDGLARASGLAIPTVAAGAATMLASIGVSSFQWVGDVLVGTAVALDAVLMSAFIVLATMATHIRPPAFGPSHSAASVSFTATSAPAPFTHSAKPS